jgi:UDP-N-acetylglucosamine--N-acetylmuramyl-(pentapeptide) pyrophosphoryl-undecaprenol N-acetylglucosamine transferase
VLKALTLNKYAGTVSDDDIKSDSESGAATAPHPMEVLWVGGIGGMEVDLIIREGIPFEAIPAAGVHGVGWQALPRNLWQILRGVGVARQIIRRFQPEVLFFTGGFVAVPLALAARLPGLGIARPASLLYVPDIEPGLALTTLARFSDRIALTDEESMKFFSSKIERIVTGYPTRGDLKSWDLDTARKTLGISGELPVLLVMGGSKGARSINRALLGALPGLLMEMEIVHISGHLDWQEVEARRAEIALELRSRYHAYPYLHTEIGAALLVADLVVSRAGASTLGEYPLFGLPAIVVPYPHAWRYQEVNARYLAGRGAAVVLPDEALYSELAPAIFNLLRDSTRRERMREAMRSLSHPEATAILGNQLLNLAAERG